MDKKIKLKFIIRAYKQTDYTYIKIKLSKTYDGNISFNNILKNLYQQYTKCQVPEEDLEPLGHSALIINKNLFEIDYNFVGLTPEPTIYNYGEIPIKKLEQQFNITKKQFEIWLDPGIGGDVGRCKGIHFFFHTKEKDIHHLPHIHCKYGGEEFRVDLNKIEILDEGFKNHKRTSLALDMIKLNQEELIKYWDNVVINGESVKFKMYLPLHN